MLTIILPKPTTILWSIIILAVLLFPVITSAQQFVPCGGPGQDPCNACHLVQMGNTIIMWLIGVLFVVFAIVLFIAGWGFITSGGNPEAKNNAKSKLLNAFIGFLIVLSAWLIVDTIVRAVVEGGDLGTVSEGFTVWNEIQCVNQRVADYLAVDAPDVGTDLVFGPGPGGIAMPVETIPAGSNCFPGPNGIYDGGPMQGGDDVCLSTLNVTGADYNLPDGSNLGYTAPTQYFGPDAIASNPQLTSNLRLCDVTNCDPSRRSGDYIVLDPFMVQQLNAIYDDLGGLQVNSGYRSPAYNRQVGGATHSRHQYGDAVDIAVTPSNTEAEIIASCRRRGATNIYTYDSGAHVHCDWRGAQR